MTSTLKVYPRRSPATEVRPPCPGLPAAAQVLPATGRSEPGPGSSLEPVLVGLPEPGLTPLRLPGRRFRVREDFPPVPHCPVAAQWRGYAADRGLSAGTVGEFNRVSLDFSGEWETCLRFPGGGFMDDVELFPFLGCIDLIPADDCEAVTQMGDGIGQSL